jgi:hypothetical protein
MCGNTWHTSYAHPHTLQNKTVTIAVGVKPGALYRDMFKRLEISASSI